MRPVRRALRLLVALLQALPFLGARAAEAAPPDIVPAVQPLRPGEDRRRRHAAARRAEVDKVSARRLQARADKRERQQLRDERREKRRKPYVPKKERRAPPPERDDEPETTALAVAAPMSEAQILELHWARAFYGLG